jgi:hypothetical protein
MRYSVVCPVCAAESDQYQCNPRLIWAQDQAIDQQPTKFQHVHGSEGLHPPLFYMWHCPRCRYTMGYRQFSAPLKDVLIQPAVITRRLQEMARTDERFSGVVNCLGDGITLPDVDFVQAIRLHLLGLHYLLAIEGLVKQHFYGRGRYAMRLGWLYRDLDAEPAKRAEVQGVVARHFETLHALWPEAPDTEAKALRLAVGYFMDTYEAPNWQVPDSEKLGVLDLVARIHMRLGDLPQANQTLSTAISAATAAKQTLDRRLALGASDPDSVPSEQRGEAVSETRRLGSLITSAQTVMETVRKDLQDQRLAAAKAMLAGLKGQQPAEQRRILLAKGVSQRLVDELVPEPRRKGLFGFGG